jgi:hypothetical protein
LLVRYHYLGLLETFFADKFDAKVLPWHFGVSATLESIYLTKDD